ncbi:MAG: hypothetical protein V3T60_08645 [Candidatus Binatia bacterium]
MKVGEEFPAAILQDIDGNRVVFPDIFSNARATLLFFYRGRF